MKSNVPLYVGDISNLRLFDLQRAEIRSIEELDENADNQQQRIKRKAFYEKNGFKPSGYIVKESAQRLEMLVQGGVISNEEIEKMYKYLMGNILGFLFGPKVIKI